MNKEEIKKRCERMLADRSWFNNGRGLIVSKKTAKVLREMGITKNYTETKKLPSFSKKLK